MKERSTRHSSAFSAADQIELDILYKTYVEKYTAREAFMQQYAMAREGLLIATKDKDPKQIRKMQKEVSQMRRVLEKVDVYMQEHYSCTAYEYVQHLYTSIEGLEAKKRGLPPDQTFMIQVIPMQQQV